MCFRLIQRRITTTATTITISSTATTKSTASSTSTRTTAACWLFLLTLISMQHHRLSQDCCQGAALQMHNHQQQEEQQQRELHAKEVAVQQENPSLNKDLSEIAINSNVTALLLPTASEHVRPSQTSDGNKVTNVSAARTTLTTTTTTETTTTLTDSTIKPNTSTKITAKFPKNDGANSDDVKSIDEIKEDFVNDAPATDASSSGNSSNSKALKQPFLAWDNPETLLRRRHIVPEKLQYTEEISIKQGRLVGIIRRMQPQTGLQDVNQYLGLPYAEAPVGSRRFMPPGTPLPWQGLKTARHLPPVCPQKLPDTSKQGAAKMSRGRYKHLTRLLPYLKNENEDCLYLNIYVPRLDGLQQTPQYPVLVYIHGESFEWNSGNAYDGSVLASYGQIIVVTVNYRLGVLGFMKPSINERTVANFGLLDQIAALHWIKENIGNFGGDRESVTLMGHSTGAACVNYLMVSPVASGLFHRAVLMSGSAMSDWAASNHSLQLTMQIAHSLDCPLMDDNDEMIDCLRAKRYQDVLKISTSFPQFSTSLGPIVDGHVIPNQPYKVMGQYTELFSRYDLLFGITELESYHTLGALALEEGLRENERDNLLRFYMQSRYDVRPDLALAATLKKYNDMYNNPIKATNMEHRDVVLDILSDARIVGPLMQTGLFHADVNPHNYMYVFGHNSAAGPHASLPHSIAGEELAFVFGAPLAPSGPFQNSYSTQEKLLAEAVMAYWTNFAKTGNPKAPWKGTFTNLHAMEWERYDLDWPEFNKRSQAYINIGIPPSIGYKYRQIYMNFWNKELPDELNQIATMQQQPFLHAYNNAQGPRGGTSNANAIFQPSRSGTNGEVITGHMSKFGNRDGGAVDPVRTLKQLLQEPYGKAASTVNADAAAAAAAAAENMYNAPPTFGVAKQQAEDELYGGLVTVPTSPAVWGVINSGNVATEPLAISPNVAADSEQEVAKSESTMHLLIGLVVVFIVLNVAIYVTFLLQKRRKKSAHSMMRKLGGAGGILSYDGNTDDELKRSKHTTHDGDDNSYILDIVRKSNTYEAVKMERSPINGYKMTRQLSCSTVDTHTKVCEWMAGGAGGGGGGGGSKLCEGIGNTLNRLNCNNISKISKQSSSTASFSELRGGSSGGGSFKQQCAHKVSVAIDATPQTRGQSVLGQQPIELSKQQPNFDGRNRIICQEVEVEDQELLMPQPILNASYSEAAELLMRQHSAATEPCDCELPQQQQQQQLQEEKELLPISHKHSRSDPVELIYELHKHDEQVTSFIQAPDINVTSRDDSDDAIPKQPLSAAEQLSLIQRRNYPKVLPTLHKRNSLPPNGLLLQQIMACGGKQPPPMPPPRTISTLGRKPSLQERRCSGGITTSPVMLAQDSTVDEEDETQQIAENTLIVGPIVPKTDFSMSLLRRSKKDSKDAAATNQQNVKASSSSSASAPAANKPKPLHLPVFSFESSPAARNTQPHLPSAHHTEAVYAIEPLNLAGSLPSMPPVTPTTPLSPLNFHTAPSTPADATRNEPNYAKSAKCDWLKGNNNNNNSINNSHTTTIGKSQIPRIQQSSPQEATTNTTTTTMTTSTNTSLTTAGSQLATTAAAAAAAAATASRIPQLNRSLNTFQQQQHQINKDHSTSAAYDKTAAAAVVATTTTATTAPIPSTPTTANTTQPMMTMTTSTTANLQNQPSIASSCHSDATSSSTAQQPSTSTPCSSLSSFASQKPTLRASCSSSISSSSSSSSSTSSSSTGTVRTELQHKH